MLIFTYPRLIGHLRVTYPALTYPCVYVCLCGAVPRGLGERDDMGVLRASVALVVIAMFNIIQIRNRVASDETCMPCVAARRNG